MLSLYLQAIGGKIPSKTTCQTLYRNLQYSPALLTALLKQKIKTPFSKNLLDYGMEKFNYDFLEVALGSP